LLREEIELVEGAGNVVLMGLSQGCAAALVAGLLWEGEPFGGVVGMCGYLPFVRDLGAVVEDTERVEDKEEDDMFERDDEGSTGGSKFERAVEWLREELQMNERESGSGRSCAMQSIPVFMGHGTTDEKVPCQNGRVAAKFLKEIDVDVEWNEYEELGHWYSEDMLRDVVRFLKGLKGWEDGDMSGE
jgi:predicted esterase